VLFLLAEGNDRGEYDSSATSHVVIIMTFNSYLVLLDVRPWCIMALHIEPRSPLSKEIEADGEDIDYLFFPDPHLEVD
jgi:hypothetical protein